MKKLMIIFLFLFACGTAVNAAEIKFEVSRISFGKDNLYDAAFNGQTYVIVGADGLAAASDDLKNWTFTQIDIGDDRPIMSMVFCNGKRFYGFFTKMENAFISDDGYTWKKTDKHIDALFGGCRILSDGSLAFTDRDGAIKVYDADLNYMGIFEAEDLEYADTDCQGGVEMRNNMLILSDGTEVDVRDYEPDFGQRIFMNDSSYLTPVYISEVNGQEYLYFMPYYGSWTIRPYDDTLKQLMETEGITVNAKHTEIDGEYLVTNGGDKIPSMFWYWKQVPRYQTLWLFDENLNLIASHEFDAIVQEFGRCNSTYYVCLANGTSRSDHWNSFMISSDFETWQEITIYEYSALRKSGSPTKKTVYEGEPQSLVGGWGEFEVRNKKDNGINSGVKYAFVNEATRIRLNTWSGTYEGASMLYMYEDGDDFCAVVDGTVYKTPKDSFYAELERLRQAPIIQIDNQILSFETAPIIEDGRTLVPMRFLFETLGADVDWNNETQTASVIKDGETVAFSINNTVASVNNKPEVMDVPARLIDEKTFVPIRFLSEKLGYDVEYDAENNKVIVHTEK